MKKPGSFGIYASYGNDHPYQVSRGRHPTYWYRRPRGQGAQGCGKGGHPRPQTVVRTLDVCENTSTNINTNNTNINTEIVLPVPRNERMKKRKYVYFEKTKKFEPASQVELLEKNDVRTNSDNTDSIRTDINSCEVEDSFDCHVHNPYFVSMSQDDLKKQKAFAERLRRKRLQKIQKECPKKAKKELTITEKIERKKIRNAKHYETRKK